MGDSTPRITAPYLEQFNQKTVRIVGKVTQLRGETATVDAGGNINVLLNRDSHLQLNNAVEIIGRVQADLSLKVLTSLDMGKDFDFRAAEAVVDATHRYRNIFYGDE